MKPTNRRWEGWLLHPFLFASYSSLMLWLANVDQVRAFTVLRPLGFSLAFALVVLLAGRLAFRAWGKAAVFATFAAVLFFSYGHIFELIDMRSAGGFVYGRHRYLLPLYGLVLAFGTVAIARLRRLDAVTRSLNVAGLFLIAAVLAQLALAGLRAPASAQPDGAPVPLAAGGGGPERDVYYIILDAYGRQDVLTDHGGPDISGFVQQLRDLGFVVQDCALSNYGWTALSLASALNMNYIEALGLPVDPASERIPYWEYSGLLLNSAVQQTFETLGYQIVTFKTVYAWLDITDSDIYYDVEKTGGFFDRQEALNMYYLFLRTTAMRFVIEIQEYAPERFDALPPALLRLVNPRASLLSSRHFKQYEQNLYAFEKLGSAAELPGKKFVYAHLFPTHQPYVFNIDGSLRWPVEESREAYFDQVVYTNTRMIDILTSIIANSPVPPVIIVQGDHSYEYSQDRMKIFNAYYLPDGGQAGLYPTITPVNTFRLVLNTYFGASYEYLPDLSYYSPRERPYQFTTVEQTCR